MLVRFRCDSPLAHGSFGESAGNATLCRRMPLVALEGCPRVPVVSGNALRGVLRRIVMRDLLHRAGATRATYPRAWDRLYAALANGGHLDGSETRVDPDRIRAIRESLPPLSVFGASLYSWMLPGHMSVGILWPRCAETIAAGVVQPGDESIGSEDLTSEESHCRHIDREHQDPEVSGVTPMPTTMETIGTGAVLESSITFAAHATEIERACIAWGLRRVQSLGGKSSVGLGRVSLMAGPAEDDERPYLAWLESAPLADAVREIAGLVAKATVTPKPVRGKRAQVLEATPDTESTEPI